MLPAQAVTVSNGSTQVGNVRKLTINNSSLSTSNGAAVFTLTDNTGTDTQTLSFSNPNITISNGNSVDISAIDTDTTLSQEQVEDYVGGLVTNGSNTTVSYDDVNGVLSIAASTGGGSGTVTSVGISGDNGLAIVSGSPITTNGTIALTINQASIAITESQITDLTHTTDTNANTICAGTTTYLDGEGNCDDISTTYLQNGAVTINNGDNIVSVTNGILQDTTTVLLTINESNINITESQISDLTHYTTSDFNGDLLEHFGGMLMLDSSTSNVGIGRTTPNEKLTVNGALSLEEISAPSNTSGYGKLYVDSSSSALYFLNDGGTNFNLTNGATASGWTDSGTNIYTTTVTDNVGIGTNSPASILDVNGAMTIHQINDASGGGSTPGYGSYSSNYSNTDISSLTITKPSGVVENDLMLAILTTKKLISNVTAPAGWTTLISYDDGIYTEIFYKVASGSEAASYNFSFNSTDEAAGVILRYSDVDTSNPINASATSTNFTSPGVITTLNNSRVIHIFTSGCDSVESGCIVGDPSSGTKRVVLKGSTLRDNAIAISDEEQANAGATNTSTTALSDDDEGFSSFTIALSPVSGGLSDPNNEQALLYTSNGSAANNGDVLIKTNVGGTTKTVKLVDYNNGRLATANNAITVNGVASHSIVQIANNLSDLASASTARTNLGVAIGTDVQAYSSVLANTTASFTTADETKLDGIEALADVTDATNVNAAGAVMESDYTPAHSLLVQQSGTGSPSILTPSNNTLLGKLTGDIDGLTASEVRTLLDLASLYQPLVDNLTTLSTNDGSNLTGVNATTVDSIDSTSFLRSDADDSFTAATLTIDGNGAFNQSVYFDALPTTTATTTTAIDWRLGNKQILDLAASITTFNWTLPAGPAGLQLQVRQNGGSLTITGYPAAVRWPGGSAPTITAADNSVDWISCIYDGTNIDCQAVQDFQ
jgi:hypothetical protein